MTGPELTSVPIFLYLIRGMPATAWLAKWCPVCTRDLNQQTPGKQNIVPPGWPLGGVFWLPPPTVPGFKAYTLNAWLLSHWLLLLSWELGDRVYLEFNFSFAVRQHLIFLPSASHSETHRHIMPLWALALLREPHPRLGSSPTYLKEICGELVRSMWDKRGSRTLVWPGKEI